MGLRLSEKKLNKLLGQSKDTETNKTNKYHNQKIKIDGLVYDSKKEYERHCELQLLERANQISNLRYHDKADTIILQQDPLIRYEPDFCYIEDGVLIIEDLKGYQTKEFRLKKKMIIGMIKNGSLKAKLRLTKHISGNFEIIEEYP